MLKEFLSLSGYQGEQGRPLCNRRTKIHSPALILSPLLTERLFLVKANPRHHYHRKKRLTHVKRSEPALVASTTGWKSLTRPSLAQVELSECSIQTAHLSLKTKQSGYAKPA